MINGDFPPTSGPVGAMGYLELIFLRFQGLIWHILGFCILLGSGDVRKNVKIANSTKMHFCKKNSSNGGRKKTADSSWTATRKSHLKSQFLSSTNSILIKGRNIQSKISKIREALIRRIKIKQKEIDQDVVIKMFDKLKEKVHNANQNGLSSLLKI